MDYEDDFTWPALNPDLDPQEHQNLLVVRFLIENGYTPEHFDGAPPPASKQIVANLEERKIIIDKSNPEKNSENCVICLKLDPTEPDDSENDYRNGNDNSTSKNTCYEKIFKVMPCSHAFHSECILPWLEKTNSCPLCRHELKTDDPSYERRQLERTRALQREADLETLHNSMFG